MTKLPTYFDYYDQTIEQNRTGLKLVLGGTGLGKTSSIVEIAKHAGTGDCKLIYMANRLQLLNEMGESLRKVGVQYAHLQSDTDVVLQLLFSQNGKQRLFDFIGSDIVQQHIAKASIKNRNLPDVVRVNKACDYIEQLKGSPQMSRRNVRDEMVRFQVRDILNFVRFVTQQIRSDAPQSHQKLLRDGLVQELFPYIRFRVEENVTVLLVTIQKAFRGFFDGYATVNLTKLNGENGNNIIFLDEFDFLENELLALICQSEQINRPFRFVEFFYKAMAHHKLPLEAYPTLDNTAGKLRDRLEKIKNIVEEIRQDGLDFPDINQFTSKLDNKKGVIFQTSRTLIHDRLFLKQTDRSFEIVKEADDGNNMPALHLFKAIRQATTQILFLFKELESSLPTIHQELLRQCYQDTDYYRAIGRVSQLPRKKYHQETRFDNLLEEGFGLYEVQELGQETDPDEVEFRYFSIYTTPERILSSLARTNLVFGLSATADIPRLVRNFNEQWLRKQEGLNYIEVEDSDIEIIGHLNEHKQNNNRKNSIEVIQGKTLDDYQSQDIRHLVEGVARDSDFGGDSSYHKKRLELFFATLYWIIETKTPDELKTDTHLLFLNTFRQIKYVFRNHTRWNNQSFHIEKHNPDSLFDVYFLNFEGKRFIVIFYDAEQARFIQANEITKHAYDELFWQELPVLVITQYPSAGNGVNLQYYPDQHSKENESEENKNKVDFLNIHLLEAPHFYFGRWEQNKTLADNYITLKQNIWYMAKLYEGQVITRNDFEKALSLIHTIDLNTAYHTNSSTRDDAILNRIATFIQAIGRIERVWREMPNQTVILSKEVWQIFELFCTRPQYADLIERRMSIISSNLQQIFTQVQAQARKNERMIRRYKEERLAAKNNKCRKRVGDLLKQLEKLRAGNNNQSARYDWMKLRDAALKHDLHNDLMKRYACLFKAEYRHYHNGILYINNDMELLPHNTPFGDDVRTWHLDSIYRAVRKNVLLRDYFEQQGYELGFNSTTQQFFTPYFYQAILVGAIGEAAIGQLLFNQGIPVTDTVPDPLFELADLRIEERPIYIDCKNYSEQTLANFDLEPDDPAWRPKLNEQDFINLAQRKLASIQRFHADDGGVKLIFLNLTSSDEWKRIYFDSNFNEVQIFGDAEIIVVPGMLKRDNPNTYTLEYTKFLTHLTDYLH
jgi:hypothetical protein